jgi:hypothetical protein
MDALGIISIQGTRFHVTFEPPSSSGGLPIENFVLEVKRGNSVVLLDETIPPNSLSTTVTGLLGYTEYSVRMAARQALYTGHYNEATIVRTLPDKPGIVGSLSATADALGQSIQLNWEQVGRRCCRHCCCRRRHWWYHRCCGSEAPPPRVSATR